MTNIDHIVDDMKQRSLDLQKLSKEVADKIEPFFQFKSKVGARLDSDIFFADMIGLVDSHSSDKALAGEDLMPLYLRWTTERLYYRKVKSYLPQIKRIYKFLSTHKKEHEFNDLDNSMYFVKAKDKDVFVLTDQNTNLLFIQTKGFLHCRRFWQLHTEHFDPKDKYDAKELEEYKKKGIEAAIDKAEWICERYSDAINGEQYVRRPSLDWFKECDFEPKYEDCRDVGYVFTINTRPMFEHDEKIEGALRSVYEIENALLNVSGAIAEIDEMEKP